MHLAQDGVLCWFDVEAGAKVGQADLRACCADASSSPSEAAVTSCTTSAEQQPQVVYAACGSTTHVMDLRAGQAPVQSFTQCSQDEVNQVGAWFALSLPALRRAPGSL